MLLAYKTKVISISDNETINLFLSTVAFLVSILSISVTITLAIDKTNKNYIITILALLIIILFIVFIVVINVIRTATPYRIMLTILEDIEKDMDQKRKKNI